MDPLQTLLDRGEITETFKREVEQLIKDTGRDLESALLELGCVMGA